MYLFPAGKGWHKVGALFIVSLMSAPGTFAQTASPKTANSSSPEPIPVVQSQKSGSSKTGLQGSVTKSSKVSVEESSEFTGGPNPSPTAASLIHQRNSDHNHRLS
jgi:hypothetical protein